MSEIFLLAIVTFIIFYFLFHSMGMKNDDNESGGSLFRNFLNPSKGDSRKIEDDADGAQKVNERTDFVKIDDAELISVTEMGLSNHIREVLRSIRSLEPDFSIDHFISGAKKAFIAIIKASTEGDVETLGYLTSDFVYASFLSKVSSLANKGLKIYRNIVKILRVDVVAVTLQQAKHDVRNENNDQRSYSNAGSVNAGSVARITLAMTYDQVFYMHDATGTVVGGAEGRVDRVNGEVAFMKEIGTSEVVWKICAFSDLGR